MFKQVDKTKFDLVMEYIRDSEDYTLEKFLTKHGLLENAKQQGDNYLISCPYHSDSSPSMSVSLNLDIYRCFGCGVGGGYMKFVSEYLSHIGAKTSVYKVTETYLKEDAVIRASLGIHSIYVVAKDTMDTVDLDLNRLTKFRQYKINTFPALANKMIKDAKSVDDKIYMISLMQSGMSVKDVYTSLYEDTFRRTHSENVTKINIQDILEEGVM